MVSQWIFWGMFFGHGEHVPLPRRTFENWAKKLNFQRYVFLGYVFAVGYVFAGPDFGIFTKKLGNFTKNGEKSDENQAFP